MKNLFKSLVVGALLLGGVGCSDMFKEDLYEINNEIDKINQRIDSLCNAVNTNIASLQTIIDVMQDNDYVDSITPIVENGVTIGYEIVFTQSGSVKIYHGEKGETGATGHSPVVGVKQAEDGRWYWTIDGEWMVNAEGKKILAEAIDGEDGAPGADGIPGIDGITPKLKVQDNYWYISYDNGTTWERLGKATGEAGTDGDSMFQSVNYNEDYVELVLVDGTVLTIPTWASHMLLVDEIAKINNNISAIQAAVKALESNDYVQKVTPVEDKEGNVIGYTLQFAFTGDVTIYHGEDGEKGEDGHTPVIGVKQFNGEWYWTIDGEWLVDGNGEMVPTSGEDGAEGAEGQAGITPELKIEDDYWYVSYDKGDTWTKLGKAKGEDGAAGGDGAAGDAFFEDVDTSDEYYIILTLADGTEIKIPTWKAHQALADAVSHLNTNVTSLQAIITGIQNNDFVTGTTEIVDPQTNEVIGYKLHFSKSGDIEIYHGKTPNAPEIGIRKHPQYGLCWTYDGEYIKDPSTGKPVALPQDGADAVAPKFKIEDGRWWMSTDGGRSWENIGQATGDQGEQGETGATGGSGDSFFKSIVPEYAKDDKGNVLKDELGRPIVAYIVMTLAGENEGEDVVYKVPTEYVTSELTKRIAAIEAQFTTISTIVNALQKAEYIKEVVELTEGLNVVGYEITFVKYTLNPDGTLSETIRKSTIRNGAGGAAGTVVDAEYDEKTGIWYWTLDGKPLIDEETGEVVPINGQAGVTPQMRINPETNFWEISYDNGNTWESTDVKATGPQGTPGQGGAAGDSFFVDVYKSSDGKFWIFERTEGEAIKVPTAEAFAALQNEVGLIKSNLNVIASAINGSKYITDFKERKDANGNVVGFDANLITYVLSYDETSGAYTFSTTDTEKIQYTANDVVTLIKKEDGYYWHIATGTSEDGTTSYIDVKVDGADWVPSVVLHADGNIYISKVSGHDESTLAADLAATGWEQYWIKIDTSKTTDTNTYSTVENILGKDGKTVVGYRITFAEGQVIEVPTKAGFDALVNDVNGLKSNVLALNDFVNGNSYIADYEPIVENGKTVGFNANLVQYTITEGEDGNWVVSDPTKSHITFRYDCTVTVVNKGTEDVPVWEWVVNGEETGIPMEGWVPEVVLHTDNNIYISKVSGHDESTLAADIERGDWAKYWIQIDTSKTQDTNTFATVTGDEKTGYEITFADGTKISVPSMDQFASLVLEVRDLQNNIKALNSFVNSNSYITDYEPIVENGKTIGFKAKQVQYTLVKGEDGSYTTSISNTTPIEFKYDCMVTVVNKGTDTAPSWEWVVNGQETGIPMDGSDWVPAVVLHTDNNIYISKANGHDANTLVKDLTEDGWEQYWIKIDTSKTTDTNTYSKVENILGTDGKTVVGYRITFAEGQVIEVPTKAGFDALVNEVRDLQNNIKALNNFVNSNSYITDYEPIVENGKTVGFKAKQVEYTLVKGEDGNYTTSISNTMPIEFYYACMVTVVNKGTEDAPVWEWVVDGEETGIPMDGSDWVPAVVLHTDNNIYISKANGHDANTLAKDLTEDGWEQYWIKIDTSKTTDTFATVTGDDIKGYEITFADGTKISVPSMAQFDALLATVNDLSKNVQALNTLMSGNNFITGFKEVKDNDGNVIGFDATVVGFQSTKNEDGTYNYTQTKGGTIEYRYNDVVTLIKKDNVYYWHILNGKSEDGTPSYIDIKVDGADWVPSVVLHADGNIYISKVSGHDESTLAADLAATGWEQYWIKIDTSKTTDTNTYSTVENILGIDGKTVVGYRITFAEGQVIEVPTKAGFDALVNEVRDLQNNIKALNNFVNNNSYITDYEPIVENGKTVGFKAKQVEYTLVKGEDGNYTTSVSKTTPIEFKYACMVTVVNKGTEAAPSWEWVVNGQETGIPVDGRDWVPSIVLHTDNNIYISKESGHDASTLAKDIENGDWEKYWIKITDTNTYSTVENILGTDGKTVVGYEITFAEGQVIEVPTKAGFDALLATVNDLSDNVTALNTLMSGNNFITGFKQVTDNYGNVIGFDATVVGFTKNQDGSYKQTEGDKIEYRYNDVVTLIKKEDGYYWHIATGTSENGTTSYIDVKVDGSDWVPAIVPYNNYVYISISPEATAGTLENDLDENGDSDKWIKIYNPQANGYTTVTPIYEDPTNTESMIVGYTITFANGDSIDAPTFITTPKISFATSGTIDYDTADKTNNYVTVEFEITGSFIDKPVVLASCEGNWISTEVELGQWAEGQRTITGSVGVKPTTAYVGDSTNGKLTLYVPYYGNTAIAQKALQASGAKEYDGETKSVGAEQTSFSIEIKAHQSLNTENAPFKLSFQPVKAGDPDPSDWISSTTQGTITGQLNGDEMTYTQDLLVERNYTGQDRSCYMHVYSPDGRKIRKVKIEQPAFDFSTVTNLADVDKTDKEDPANCYIISQPGYYKFPVVKGNTNTRVVNGDDLTKDIFGDTHINGGNNPIDILAYDDNYVYFKVDAASINPGNSLITVKDGNNIAWSWHLWFCSSTPGTLEAINGEESLMMDRNLGAIAPELDLSLGTFKIDFVWKEGLYYQWGRKDPLLAQTPKPGGTYENTKANPSVLYSDWDATDEGAGWNESKSLNDPCPPGYKIPSSEQWKDTGDDVYKVEEKITHSMLDINYYVYDVQTNNLDNVVLFNYGYLDENNGQPIYIHENVVRSGTVPNGKYASTTAIDGLTMNGAIRYTNANFTLTSNEKFGALWNSDSKTSLYYSYLKPTKVTVNSGTKEKFSGFFIGSWKTDKLTPGETQTDANLLMDFRNYVTTTYSPEYQISPAAGLQVRCVKELKE